MVGRGTRKGGAGFANDPNNLTPNPFPSGKGNWIVGSNLFSSGKGDRIGGSNPFLNGKGGELLGVTIVSGEGKAS